MARMARTTLKSDMWPRSEIATPTSANPGKSDAAARPALHAEVVPICKGSRARTAPRGSAGPAAGAGATGAYPCDAETVGRYADGSLLGVGWTIEALA